MDRYSKSIIWASWIFRAGLLVWTFDPLIENISKGNELLIEVWSNLSFGLLVVSALFELVMLIINHKRFIKALENSINGKSYRYIPKTKIANNSLFRKTILDGDIIVIITNKKGLDTTHIGIASWHSDGLHLLNASSIHKKVIDEPMTLRTYMSKHPSQIGIRVCRVR